MGSLRDHILKAFTPGVARLTLVDDPDGLLFEEGILDGIRERGFELLPFEDHIAFRYTYELRFRSRWDCGESTNLAVVFRSSDSNLWPYDLLQVGARLSFRLSEIFPNLSCPVVKTLDRRDLDALYEACERHAPKQKLLGDNDTRDFILRYVFEITPELVRQPADLLRVLLRRHYRRQRIPTDFDERFIQLLRQNQVFDGWPLETLVSDREAFFAFLQEHWPSFLDREAAKRASSGSEDRKSCVLSTGGPAEVPFDHPDVRVYIDNLFAEGILRPVQHEKADVLLQTWVGIGLRKVSPEERLSKLIDHLEKKIPFGNASYTDWFLFARGWAEIILLSHDQTAAISERTVERFRDLQIQVDDRFMDWTRKRYAGLVNLPPVDPVMVHHIPRFLARQLEDKRHSRIALLVLDGLALDQWLVVREALATRQNKLRFEERMVFAWIPSLTSVSRQSIFAGKFPFFFPKSIWRTDEEPRLWAQFWTEQGLTRDEVVYAKESGDGKLESVSEALSHSKVKVAGLVVDKVDKIMHGMQMGTAGMHNQVGQWARGQYLGHLIAQLLEQDFGVYLTSDHGNIEAEGYGLPSEGALADIRGERVRIYSSANLRTDVKERFPDALGWGAVGLPDDCFALLAPSRKAFVREHERIVCHGGVSVEELIVPLVHIERRSE